MRYKQLFLDHMAAKNATRQSKWLDCNENVVMLTCQSQNLLTPRSSYGVRISRYTYKICGWNLIPLPIK